MGKFLAVLAGVAGTVTFVMLGLSPMFLPEQHQRTASAVAALSGIPPLHLYSDPYSSYSYSYQSSSSLDPAAMQAAQQAQWEQTKMELIYRFVIGGIVGILWYFIVVKNYPVVDREGQNDKRHGSHVLNQGILDCFGCYGGTLTNCFCAVCCFHARAAQTMHATGVANYWGACCALLTPLFPCVLCWASLGTDMLEKIGDVGSIPPAAEVIFQVWCCMWCKVAREAAALDACQGVETTLCGVGQKVNNDYQGYP